MFWHFFVYVLCSRAFYVSLGLNQYVYLLYFFVIIIFLDVFLTLCTYTQHKKKMPGGLGDMPVRPDCDFASRRPTFDDSCARKGSENIRQVWFFLFIISPPKMCTHTERIL